MPAPLPAGLVRSLVDRAVRAPSSHNSQPWIFRQAGDVIELYADRSRALPVNDPDDRELFISCGAALLNLRLAAHHHRLAPVVALLPDTADANLCARVGLSPLPHRTDADADADADESLLYEAIDRRRTCRKPFADRPLPTQVLPRLLQAAEQEGAGLSIVAPDRRGDLAALIEQGDVRQFADRAWRRELAFWMRPRRHGDGLTVPAVAAPLIRTGIRSADLGARVGRRDAALLRTAPLAAVLTSRTDEPSDWLATGQALQRGLLVLAAHGILAGYANQPCELGEPSRGRLRDMLPGLTGHPQIVIRAGYPARPVPVSPRRPLTDVLDVPHS
ncbi:Acg family FMN-binding oxidoreductase [Streptomyces sp. NPDC054841]